MATYIWVNTGSGNDLLSEGPKPMPEPMLTGHQYHYVNLRWGNPCIMGRRGPPIEKWDSCLSGGGSFFPNILFTKYTNILLISYAKLIKWVVEWLHAKCWDCETVGTVKQPNYVQRMETMKQSGLWSSLGTHGSLVVMYFQCWSNQKIWSF